MTTESSPTDSLPRGVPELLRQRGVATGPVLMIADGLRRTPTLEPAPQFEVTSASASDLPALAGGSALSAIVLSLDTSRKDALESILTSIAPLVPQGLLVIVVQTRPDSARSPDVRQSAHLAFLRSGYEQVWVHSYRKALCISARRAGPQQARRTCSVIVPVFNEKETFPQLMRALLEKRLDHLGLEREIILVESNSSDGTRELVAGFAGVPGVKVLWEDRPRGKGHAVRAGLKIATGDIVLIQDADLEYDLGDYDALLKPLLEDQAAFVLGCRHGGRARMRRFSDQWVLAEVLNAAHILFTTLINVLYGQNMKDPLTMFKVFRRDCLYGLHFECNRFDFDHELVIKLVLKGYRPLEIPVSYRARSFKQGKKIRLFRDPPGLIAADLKYRVQRLRPRFE